MYQPQRRKRNSSRVNLTISAIFHGLLLVGVGYFAAREGVFGKRFQQITVSMVKEKQPEAPKEKPQQPKVEPPKPVTAPKPAAEVPRAVAVTPPPSDGGPAVAPAAVSLPSFDFNDGAKDVLTSSDPGAVYRGGVEHAFRSHWNRPENVKDDQYYVDVELTVDQEGNITSYRWLKGSGDTRWDDSVKEVLTKVKSLGRQPPKGFPTTFTLRFDVESGSQEGIQLSSK